MRGPDGRGSRRSASQQVARGSWLRLPKLIVRASETPGRAPVTREAVCRRRRDRLTVLAADLLKGHDHSRQATSRGGRTLA
jgi:hypothetical protein